MLAQRAGKKSTERHEHERQRWFKRARRFRAGIEGRISVMKRREYLGRFVGIEARKGLVDGWVGAC